MPSSSQRTSVGTQLDLKIMTAKASKNTVLACLVLLLCAQASALDCNFLKQQQQLFNSHSLKHLQKMSQKLLPECSKESQTPVLFPSQVLKIQDPRLALKMVEELLKGLFAMFNSDLLQSGQENSLRERFLNMLFAQSRTIKRCLAERKLALQNKEELITKLRSEYFQGIRAALKQEGCNACNWERVKLEGRTVLVYINILTNRMDGWNLDASGSSRMGKYGAA